VVYFTQRKLSNRKNSFSANKVLGDRKGIKFLISVDGKGRILIPADVRKTLGINTSDKLILEVLIRKNCLIIYSKEQNCPYVYETEINAETQRNRKRENGGEDYG